MKRLKKFYSILVRNNKKMIINSSGSTPNAKKEKIRSGQSYLYQKNGMESEVFEVTFYKNINGGMLNQALSVTLKRYPYINTKVVELDGDFYIVQNEIALTAKKTKVLPQLGHINWGYHLVDITYFDRTIYISWHHALCDGKGIKPFVETLIYYYCQLKYRSKASAKEIRLAEEPLLLGETTEPNLGSYSYDENKEFINISRDAYAISENVIEEHETDYRYDLQVSASSFMKICKENHATPVILTSLLVSKGITELYPDFDKPINANIAVDIREALDLPNTFKNCVRSMPLPFDRTFLSMTLKEQAEKQRMILNNHRDKDNLRRIANLSLGMYDKLDSLPDYKSKQGMMDFFNGMLINTYFISYLGQLIVNENAKYIDTVGFYNSGAAGLGVNILACGDKFCFNFKQSFESDKYVKAFCNELSKLGIEYKVSEVIPFLTPKDSLIKRKEK
ncbi:MAG: hypothetical protein IJX78_07655 [Bacilli bacterium]|nr:hypothetical protein [Bacilli bacterium]